MHQHRLPQRRWLGAVSAVVAGVTLALGVTFAVRATGAQTIFVFFTAAVALIAWGAGATAATVATFLSTIAAGLAFSDIHGDDPSARTADMATLISFLLVGILIAQVTGALRRSRDQARVLAHDAQEARAATQRALDHAEEANQVKDRFLASMSHELRTPLNAVVSYCSLLDDDVLGPINDRQRDALHRMRAAAHHLSQLVNDVLDVARADSGGLTLEREPFDIARVAEEATQLVEPQARLRRIRIVTDTGPRHLDALGDAKRSRQIVVNLLANAVKFSPDGGTVWVSWGSDPDLERNWISVRDSGIGIAPEQHERIFEAFAQVANQVTKTTVGSGLGLTISRRLARAMGGDIEVDSRIGSGATFILSLPAAAHEVVAAAHVFAGHSGRRGPVS